MRTYRDKWRPSAKDRLGIMGGARSLPELMWSLESEVVKDCGTHLGHKVLEAGNDVGALKFLIVAEAASDHNHSNESHCQVQLGAEVRESVYG